MIAPSPKPDSDEGSHDSLQELARCLMEVAKSCPDLTIGVQGSLTPEGGIADREKGIAIAFAPDDTSAESQMWISERRAKLVTRNTESAGIWTEITDRMAVSLAGTPAVAGQPVGSLESLVSILLSLMEARVRHASLTTEDLEDEGSPERALVREAI